MDRIVRARPSSSMVVALIALFVALSGTAVALDGSNTVFSDDIVNGEVKNNDLAADSVASGKIADRQVKNADLSIGASSSNTIADGGIQGVDVKGDTLTPAHIADVGFLQAETARLRDQPGGGSANQELFTIGRIRLVAGCQVLGNGRLLGTVQPAPTEEITDDGPVMVLDGEGASDDFFVRLQSGDVQFVVSASSDTGLDAQETSFAILHEADASVTGVAAASVDPTTGDCVMSVQVVG